MNQQRQSDILTHRIIRLPNGLRLVLIQQPHLHSVTAAMAIGCGSRHETLETWGISHLLEHMLFRGSSHFSNSQALAQVFEASGSTLTASTWRDHTSFYCSFHPSDMQAIVSAMANMVIAPLLDDLALEQPIIIEEIQAELDHTGCDTDLSNASRAHIWHGHAMGRRITGSVHSVQHLSKDALVQHHQRYYTACNTTLCIAGCIDFDMTIDLVCQAFGDMQAGVLPLYSTPVFAPPKPLLIHTMADSQVAMQLTFKADSQNHQHFATQALLARILDDGLMSRLPQALSEKTGLVYELNSGLDCYSDCGLYDIEMFVSPHKLIDALGTTIAVLHNIQNHGCFKQEIQTAKKRAQYEIECRIDSTEEIAVYYAEQALFMSADNLGLSLNHAAAMYEDVSYESLLHVARSMFTKNPMHITLIGPVDRALAKDISLLQQSFSLQHHAAATKIGETKYTEAMQQL